MRWAPSGRPERCRLMKSRSRLAWCVLGSPQTGRGAPGSPRAWAGDTGPSLHPTGASQAPGRGIPPGLSGVRGTRDPQHLSPSISAPSPLSFGSAGALVSLLFPPRNRAPSSCFGFPVGHRGAAGGCPHPLGAQPGHPGQR